MRSQSLYRVTFTDARVRDERRERFQELTRYLFNRRSLAHVDLWDMLRHGKEINAFLRRQSEVYTQLSTEKEGPLLFGLGYLRLDGAYVQTVSSELPVDSPADFCCVLSEFIQPGATVRFERKGQVESYVLRGISRIEKKSG